MRCKVGDIAVVVGFRYYPSVLGRLVEVIGAVPPGVTTLPNGYSAESVKGHDWIARSLGGEFPNEMIFGTCPDSLLRPIRRDADPVETETEREIEVVA